MTRRARQRKAARLETDRDRLALEVARLRSQNLTLMFEAASLRERMTAPQPRSARAPRRDLRSYAEIQRARHVARVEMRNAAARYGRLANWRTRTHAVQEEFDRAKRELDEAAQAFVDADVILIETERELVQEVRLA